MKHHALVGILVIICAAIVILAFGGFIGKHTNIPVDQDPSKNDVAIETCPGILISNPTANQTVSFPLIVSGVAHPDASHVSSWIVFEGQAGSVSVKDLSGNVMSNIAPLTISGDWMNANPKNFSAQITSVANPTNIHNAVLEFNDDDPSGDNPHTCSVPIHI